MNTENWRWSQTHSSLQSKKKKSKFKQYVNSPVYFSGIFTHLKMTTLAKDCNIYLIYAQNINCGYSLE